MNIEKVGKLLRQKGLCFSVIYKRVRTGKKCHGWKWLVSAYHENGANRHVQANSPKKAIEKLLEIEGVCYGEAQKDNPQG